MESLNETPRSRVGHIAVKRRNSSSGNASPSERYTKQLCLTFRTVDEKQAFEDMFASVKLVFGQISNRNTDTVVQALHFVLEHQHCQLQGIAACSSPIPAVSPPAINFRLPLVQVPDFRSPPAARSKANRSMSSTPTEGTISSQAQSPSVVSHARCSPIGLNVRQSSSSSTVEEVGTSHDKQWNFVCQSDRLGMLIAALQDHSRYCPEHMRCASHSLTGVVANVTFQCKNCHVVQWSSSKSAGAHYEVNVRCIMAFACSGMLRVQFDKFLQFFCIGQFTWRAINNVLHPLSAIISVLSRESLSRALYEEVARTAETTSDSRCVRLMTDARHACRKNSHHSDVVAIGQVTRKVINIQHVTKADDKSTQRHEVLGTTRLYAEFTDKNIKVSFLTLFYYALSGCVARLCMSAEMTRHF